MLNKRTIDGAAIGRQFKPVSLEKEKITALRVRTQVALSFYYFKVVCYYLVYVLVQLEKILL